MDINEIEEEVRNLGSIVSPKYWLLIGVIAVFSFCGNWLHDKYTAYQIQETKERNVAEAKAKIAQMVLDSEQQYQDNRREKLVNLRDPNCNYFCKRSIAYSNWNWSREEMIEISTTLHRQFPGYDVRSTFCSSNESNPNMTREECLSLE